VGAGHGGSDSKAARFVGAGGHHPSRIRTATYNYWFSSKLWVIQLFNRGIERIHIDVDYFSVICHSQIACGAAAIVAIV
jgi:hypothetical protein